MALTAWSILLGCATPGSSRESSQARIDELERENEALVGRLATLESVLAIMGVKRTVCRFDFVYQPPIDAVVLDLNEALGIVTLDKGRRDGVKEGYDFDVFLGTQYKGHVRVRDVEDATCSAIIVNALGPIVRGDSARTCL